MPSLRNRVFNLLLRNRNLLRGRLGKEVFDSRTSIPAFREQCERTAARLWKKPDGITVTELRIGAMKAEVVAPSGADSTKLVLYVHGGGYVSGSCADHRAVVAGFAMRTGFACLTYEYRLAPEHPFPAAVEDSLAAYRGALEQGRGAADVLLAGESAGGGLALALLLAAKERGLPMPAGAVAISPWTDLTCSGDSYRTKNRWSLAPLNSWTVFGAHYVGAADARDPLVSPLFGDLRGLPPLLVNAGEEDELFDDGRRFAEAARAAGVAVTFRAGAGQVHCYPLLAPMFPEATEAMAEIREFARKRLGG